MKIIDIFIDRKTYSLNQTFSYQVTSSQYQQLMLGSAVLVDFAHKNEVGYVVAKRESPAVSYKIKPIREILLVDLFNKQQQDLFNYLNDNLITTYADVMRMILPKKVRLALKQANQDHKITVNKQLCYQFITDAVDLTAKQDQVLSIIKISSPISRKELLLIPGVSSAVVANLLKLQAIKKIYLANSYQPQVGKQMKPKVVLNQEQQQCLKLINTTKLRSTLLFGITGSGKTEIYIELIKQAISNKEQVLLLVPEITLTAVITERLQAEFGEKLVYIHSKVATEQYYSYYQRIKTGDAQVIVGTRSSIFMPFQHLRYIIVDEEHDLNYKNNGEPYYHVRDIIQFWLEQFPSLQVVYGSATPSIESYARATNNVYQLVKLEQRYRGGGMRPLNKLEQLQDYQQIFTPAVLVKIKQQLEQAKKVIILYNKKGYSSTVECRVCNAIELCPSCQIPVVYYQQKNQLVCKYCGYKQRLPVICSSCQSRDSYQFVGIGLEQVINYLVKMFGQYQILQLDADVAHNKKKLNYILAELQTAGSKILVGTQLVAKGLDLVDVDLVVVVNVDNMLYFNDLKNQELLYQLLVQTAGRAGRDGNQAEVIIQTKQAQQKIFSYVVKYDYNGFYQNEMKNRLVQRNTPYFNICQLQARHQKGVVATGFLLTVQTELVKAKFICGKINDPYVNYANGKIVKVMLVKYKKQEIIKLLKKFQAQALQERVDFIVDLNIVSQITE